MLSCGNASRERGEKMKESTSIIFTGDIGFDRYMDRKWEDENLLSQSVLDYFRSGDHVVANVEGAVVDPGSFSSEMEFIHYMPVEASAFLKKINADIWELGNNHILDAGMDGLVSTCHLAEEMGCQTIGAGRNREEASMPVYIDEAGGIGMIGVTYLSEYTLSKGAEFGRVRWNDFEQIGKRIAEIKSKCRWCVIVVHGGEEFAPMPLPYTRDKYMKYLELGADVVVGHHPHVPENYELFDDGKAVFYSLGNFVFDTDYQRAHRYSDTGVLLKLKFTEEKMDFEALGLQLDRETERIDAAELPGIFTDIPADEYELLIPLGAKAFLEEEKRRMIYLEPENYKELSEDGWLEYFNGKPDGYFKGEHMDLSLSVPLAERADSGKWKESKLEQVKEYLKKLL